MTIGVFDSGVGGLTVLRAIHRRLPGRATAYLGDTARVPYGTRSPETVIRYAKNAARLLVEREDPSVLVIACNTASAVAIEPLQAALSVPVIGVIDATARRAAELGRGGRIGIIGTAGTVRSGAYERAVARAAPEARTVARACPLFVPLAEEGWTDPSDPVVRQVVARYLEPLLDEGVDTLILGCTHYPLLARAIAAVLGPNVALADAADAVADEVAARIAEPAVEAGDPLRRYYVTDAPAGFRTVAERFLGGPVPELLEVDL